MAEVGYITADAGQGRQGQAAQGQHPPARHADLCRRLLRRGRAAHAGRACFGEDGLYGRAERAAAGDGRINGGLSVRTTLDPNLQRMARKALIDGLVAFDREKGWRGALQKIDIAGDWGAALTGIEIPGDLAPWRLGVVLEAQQTKAVVGLRPAAAGRRQLRG